MKSKTMGLALASMLLSLNAIEEEKPKTVFVIHARKVDISFPACGFEHKRGGRKFQKKRSKSWSRD